MNDRDLQSGTWHNELPEQGRTLQEHRAQSLAQLAHAPCQQALLPGKVHDCLPGCRLHAGPAAGTCSQGKVGSANCRLNFALMCSFYKLPTVWPLPAILACLERCSAAVRQEVRASLHAIVQNMPLSRGYVYAFSLTAKKVMLPPDTAAACSSRSDGGAGMPRAWL